ncbi:MAG: helix-turn-helix domain-containing protein [Alphaproteobacteria bacterium]
MTELEIIGKNIVRTRKEQNITQEDLCGMAEIDRSFLSSVENGKGNVSVKTLVTIANCLNTTLTNLVEKEKSSPKKA